MYFNNTRQAVRASSSSGADGGGGGKKTDGDILCRLGNCEGDKVARLILKVDETHTGTRGNGFTEKGFACLPNTKQRAPKRVPGSRKHGLSLLYLCSAVLKQH